jgi:L-asparaginase II
MVAGEGRFTTEAMRVIPGLILKEGAEGVEIGVLPDGTSFAFKVIDGSMRALPVIVAAALECVGVTSAPLQQLAKSEVLGGGNVVGEIRSVLNQS